MRSKSKRIGFLLACVVPAVVLFTIFMVIPTVNVFRMSLYESNPWAVFSGAPRDTFIGFENFKTLMGSSTFIRSLQNMLLMIVMVTIFTMGTALVFAGILTREKLKGQNFFRIVFYIPNILSVVVISGIFSALYDPQRGILNSIIGLFGGNGITWKSEQNIMMSLIIAMVWQAIGYYMVMYMSSMAAVPESLYESAGLDGANRFTQFFQITIPLIWTNIRTTLTFFVISTINMAYMFVTAMTSGGPNDSSNVALFYMYQQKDAGAYGYAMAAGVVIFVVSFGLSALVNAVTKREVLEY